MTVTHPSPQTAVPVHHSPVREDAHWEREQSWSALIEPEPDIEPVIRSLVLLSPPRKPEARERMTASSRVGNLREDFSSAPQGTTDEFGAIGAVGGSEEKESLE